MLCALCASHTAQLTNYSKKNFVSTGVPKVLFGDVPANKVAVAGPGWITGHIPPSPEGTCDTDIVLQFGPITLTLPEAFCYIAA